MLNELPAQVAIFNEGLVKVYYTKCGTWPGGLSFTNVNDSSVLKKLSELNSNKAAGLHNIPAKYFKNLAKIIIPVVTHIINLWITFPRTLRLIKVPEDLKKIFLQELFLFIRKVVSWIVIIIGQFQSWGFLSKVLERIIYDQVEDYVSNYYILEEL